MKLDSFIKNLGQTKVASAAAPPTKTAAETAAPAPAVTSAIRAALATIEQSKTASAPNSVEGDLKKIASETLAVEKTAEERHAHRLGEVMADGFASRLETYRAASEDLLSKQAAVVEGGAVSAEELALVKMARENPEAFLAEVQKGFQETMDQTKEAAERTYAENFDETVRTIHKKAADHYLAGYSIVAELAQTG
jgi:hypothetical protein